MGAYCKHKIDIVLNTPCCSYFYSRSDRIGKEKIRISSFLLEREKSLELSTSTLARLRSTN